MFLFAVCAAAEQSCSLLLHVALSQSFAYGTVICCLYTCIFLGFLIKSSMADCMKGCCVGANFMIQSGFIFSGADLGHAVLLSQQLRMAYGQKTT